MGHFVPWDGGCLLIGRVGDVIPVHAHYAIQIAFGSSRGIRFRAGDHDAWTEYAGAIIPSRQPHAMDATHVHPSAVLLVEPETREGRALTERWLLGGIAAIPDAALADAGPALFSAWAYQPSVATVTAAAQRVVRVLAGGVAPAVVSDERILRAVAHIRAHLDARSRWTTSPTWRVCRRAASGTCSWSRPGWRCARTSSGAASCASGSC